MDTEQNAPLGPESLESRFRRLLDIVARLRGRGGCPWDRAQTLESMRSCLLEECWEALDTVNRRDLPHLQEELGDLLLNILLLCDIANSIGNTEKGASGDSGAGEDWQNELPDLPNFNSDHFLHAVLEDLCTKLVNRHPHVFGQATAANAEEALGNWQKVKEAEKTGRKSLLSGVNAGQAGLLYALKLQKRAAKAGFDWPAATATQDISGKIMEELDEFREALVRQEQDKLPGVGQARQAQQAPNTRGEAIGVNEETDKLREQSEEELGDLLFSVVNLARVHDFNPELALARSCEKFRQRFQHIEQRLAGQQRSVHESSLEEMEALWQEAKADLERGREGKDRSRA
ncbi:MazG nucleotide pyrophosphohydrolase domain-containing protein [Candidatus Haliotispira prima]|uniref:MazG nucleotide pyrophosphohydrolase domain-containing protein n=1 Tax=Candidatus Haliotispira prima TaxID=3034016 RepID=A0ABY8MF53_9SPIO|nr:MazG nucleotide pyrophosphohydrolase domain-containing protein [Candidatus Haliotispira prima]